MKINEYSPLTLLRFNQDISSNSYMELWDPETNINSDVNLNTISNFEGIKKYINSLKLSVCERNNYTEKYNHWICMGWNKSLDYYVSTKVFNEQGKSATGVIKSLMTKKAVDSSNQMHKIPEALLLRRTRRVFVTETLKEDTFYKGISNFIPSIFISDKTTGFEYYFIIYNVENITPGIYKLNLYDSTLTQIELGNYRDIMSQSIQGMRAPKTASFTVIPVANFKQLATDMPYSRGLRDSYIEIGRIAQKIIISYMIHGIFCLATPALSDRLMNNLLNLPEPQYAAIYSLTFGISFNNKR